MNHRRINGIGARRGRRVQLDSAALPRARPCGRAGAPASGITDCLVSVIWLPARVSRPGLPGPGRHCGRDRPSGLAANRGQTAPPHRAAGPYRRTRPPPAPRATMCPRARACPQSGDWSPALKLAPTSPPCGKSDGTSPVERRQPADDHLVARHPRPPPLPSQPKGASYASPPVGSAQAGAAVALHGH